MASGQVFSYNSSFLQIYFSLDSHLVKGKVSNCSNVSRLLFPLHLNLSNEVNKMPPSPRPRNCEIKMSPKCFKSGKLNLTGIDKTYLQKFVLISCRSHNRRGGGGGEEGLLSLVVHDVLICNFFGGGGYFFSAIAKHLWVKMK